MFKLILVPFRIFIKAVLLGGCGCAGLIVGALLVLVIGLVLLLKG